MNTWICSHIGPKTHQQLLANSWCIPCHDRSFHYASQQREWANNEHKGLMADQLDAKRHWNILLDCWATRLCAWLYNNMSKWHLPCHGCTSMLTGWVWGCLQHLLQLCGMNNAASPSLPAYATAVCRFSAAEAPKCIGTQYMCPLHTHFKACRHTFLAFQGLLVIIYLKHSLAS